jgi:hypothetical protein
MSELKTATTVVEIAFGVAALLLLGDYLGHKVGGGRLAKLVGIMLLIIIVAFTVYAAIVLA